MLKGVVVVTGASRGIGRAIASRAAAEGADVICVGRSAAELASLQEEISTRGRQALPLELDLTAAEAGTELVRRSWAWKGRVDALVNAAGILIRKPEEAVTADDWDATLRLNVRTPSLLMRDIGTRMRERGRGAIVNIASIAGERVTGAPAAYQASKAALIQATRFFARNLAPEVRVNAVGPGYVWTDLSKAWLSVDENRNWVENRTPLGRVAQTSDVTGAVVFLLSEDARFVTGQHLLVDGGWSVQ